MNWISIKNVDLERWHRWFVWFPVRVKRYPDDAVKYAWLETVERCGTWIPPMMTFGGYWLFKYRETK